MARRNPLGTLVMVAALMVAGIAVVPGRPTSAQTPTDPTTPLPSKAPPSIYYGPDGRPLPGAITGDPANPTSGGVTVPSVRPSPVTPTTAGPVPTVPGGMVFTPPAIAAAAKAAQAELDRATGTRAKAQENFDRAKNIRAEAQDAATRTTGQREEADRNVTKADSDVAQAKARLAEAAVATYVGRPDRAATESAARAYVAEDVQISYAAVRAVRQNYLNAVTAQRQAADTAGTAAEAQDRAAAALPGTQAAVDEAEKKVQEADGEVTRLTDVQRATTDELTAAENEIKVLIATDLQVMAAKAGGSTGGAGDRTPTVLGPSLMTAHEIALWYRNTGSAERTTEPMDRVAAYYIHEAKVLGVRADLAYAQAMLETGAFTSPLTTQSNFAGIGACDSCATGYGYSGVQLGVRAQMQLLRAYADPGATSAGFGYPAVKTQPETLGVRGCCDTWGRLTGVWATDPGYGPKIMEIYHRMLQFTITQRLAAQPGDLKARQDAAARLEKGELGTPTAAAGAPGALPTAPTGNGMPAVPAVPAAPLPTGTPATVKP